VVKGMTHPWDKKEAELEQARAAFRAGDEKKADELFEQSASTKRVWWERWKRDHAEAKKKGLV